MTVNKYGIVINKDLKGKDVKLAENLNKNYDYSGFLDGGETVLVIEVTPTDETQPILIYDTKSEEEWWINVNDVTEVIQ